MLRYMLHHLKEYFGDTESMPPLEVLSLETPSLWCLGLGWLGFLISPPFTDSCGESGRSMSSRLHACPSLDVLLVGMNLSDLGILMWDTSGSGCLGK